MKANYPSPPEQNHVSTSPWLVSLIIPVYNVRPYLEETLNSVLAQTYRRLEILLIDDGSTDGSGEICDLFAAQDPRITVIHQRHRGVSAARNAGLDRMSGELVAFLDSDDALHPSMIRTMVLAMIRSKADCVMCQYSYYRDSGTEDQCMERNMDPAEMNKYKVSRARPGTWSAADAMRAMALNRFTVFCWDKLFRREVWDDLRYPEGHVYEDQMMIYPLLEKTKKICVIEDPLVLHRRRAGSITTCNRLRSLKDWDLAHHLNEQYIEDHIPAIFSDEHLRATRQKHAAMLLVQSIKSPGFPGDPAEKESIYAFTGEKLRELAPYVKGFSPKVRTAFAIYSRSPRLLARLYPPYYSWRMLTLRLIKR